LFICIIQEKIKEQKFYRKEEQMQLQQRTINHGEEKELLHFNQYTTIGEKNGKNPNGRNGNGEILSNEEYQDKQTKNRIKTLRRNTAKLWRLYNCNKGQYKQKDKFMTLTFRELPQTIDEADYELNKFIKRLKYYCKKKFEYLGIRELQLTFDRNGIHYHIIFFGLPYIKHSELLKLWCYGNPYQDKQKPSGVNIKAINEGYKEMSNYLTSYQLKDILDHDFVKGKYTLLKSMNLIQPTKKDFEKKTIFPTIDQIKKGLSFIENKITYYRLG